MALTLLSPLNNIYRRDVSVDASDLTDPTDGACLVAGEWVNLNSSGQAEDDNYSTFTTFQVFTDKGDYSAQALGKVTILNSFDYIAETDQYETGISAGNTLKVHTNGKLTVGTTAGDLVVAVALNSPSGTTQLKFQRLSPFKLHS